MTTLDMRTLILGGAIFGACLPAAHAETDAYCADHQAAIQAQIKRGETGKCTLQGALWERDPHKQFQFCRGHDAPELQYWHNQRESELKNCEYLAAPRRETVRDIRVSGGPGDYTIHWTISRVGCEDGGLGETCSVQLRLETPPGRTGGFAVELRGENGNKAFTTTRADRYPGQPGDVVVLKWHTCSTPGIGSSHCTAWRDMPLVMPRPAPEYRAPRVTAVNPNRYTPQRFDQGRTVALKNAGDGVRVLRLRVDGTMQGFSPASFQGGEAWQPRLKVRLLERGVAIAEFDKPEVLSNGEVQVRVPVRALNQLECRRNVAVTGVCTVVDVELESARYFTSGNPAPIEAPVKSRTELRIDNPVAALGPQEQAKGSIPSITALSWPASIISQCNTIHHIGNVALAARQANVDRHTVRALPLELQFAAGQGLWGTSPLLTSLVAVPDTSPPEYRASLSAAQLTPLASRWRWRVRAVEGERRSEWCHFEVSATPGTAAVKQPTTSQPKPPGTPIGGASSGQASTNMPAKTNASSTAPLVPGAPQPPSPLNTGESRTLNAPVQRQ